MARVVAFADVCAPGLVKPVADLLPLLTLSLRSRPNPSEAGESKGESDEPEAGASGFGPARSIAGRFASKDASSDGAGGSSSRLLRIRCMAPTDGLR